MARKKTPPKATTKDQACEIIDLILVPGVVPFAIRINADDGSTFEAGASDYRGEKK